MKETREGSENSFQEIFDACYVNLCKYAFTMLKDMDEAEDIVQGVFLKYWEKKDSLTITHTVRSYLYKAVYNHCINQLEHQAIRKRFQEQSSLTAASDSQSPEVFPHELEERITDVINGLPEQCRLIFTMSRYQEMRYAEIAAKLEISVNTVENQVSKALRILRTQLKDIYR
jgi:RNA polymerase sigma-70 factor (ECF subfamily)